MSVLSTIGIAVACLVGLVALGALLVLLVPAGFRAEGQIGTEVLRGFAELRWGGGILAVRADPARGVLLYVLGLGIWRFRADKKKTPDKETREAPLRAKKRDEKEGQSTAARLRWALRHRRLLVETGLRALRALHLRLCARGVIGLGDPADTALLFALADEALGRLPGVELDLERDDLDETLEITASLSAWVWTVQVAAIAIALLLRADGRRALREAF